MGTPRHKEVIYKRRRLAALVILLVVVVLIIAGVTALRGGSSEDESENTAATSPLVAASAVAANTGDAAGSSVDSTNDPEATGAADSSEEPRESSESAEPTASPSESSTEEPEEATKASCELSDLVITASSNKPNFTPGEQPQLYMTVANPTKEDCEIDLDDNVLRFEVYDLASNARIWSDVDCNPAVETGTRVFPAGEERFFQAIWSRTGSAPERCSNRQLVPAGAYFLHTVIGDNPSQAHTFNLR